MTHELFFSLSLSLKHNQPNNIQHNTLHLPTKIYNQNLKYSLDFVIFTTKQWKDKEKTVSQNKINFWTYFTEMVIKNFLIIGIQ